MSETGNSGGATTPATPGTWGKLANWFKAKKEQYGELFAAVALVLAFIWVFVSQKFEDVRKQATAAAKEAAKSPEVIADISKRIRPYGAFHVSVKSAATFDFDAGVGDLIEAVTLEKSGKMFGLLTVKLRRFTAVPPLIRPLTANVYLSKSWRTNKFDWAFELRPAPETVESEGVLTTGLSWGELEAGANYSFLVELFAN